MNKNAVTEVCEHITLFGIPALFTNNRIDRSTVPDGWYCYDLRGSDDDPGMPQTIENKVSVNHAGTILSPNPIPFADGKNYRHVRGKINFLGDSITLAEFCGEHQSPVPCDSQKYILRPASSQEAGLFYSLPPEKDEELGAIGHVRIDFGRDGEEFWHSWWPRGPEELNTPEFKDELGKVVDDLRKGILKELSAMLRRCHGSEGAIGGGICCQNYGFSLETERYLYRLRCNPIKGDYQAYLSCFDKQAQKVKAGLTERGQQRLRDAADPNIPHSYDWYVMEAYNTADEKFTSGLSLEDAIQHYNASENGSKRLGVTKDDIAAVDLVIKLDGREWLSKDYQQLDSFAEDPVVKEAVSQLRHILEEQTASQNMTMGGIR